MKLIFRGLYSKLIYAWVLFLLCCIPSIYIIVKLQAFTQQTIGVVKDIYMGSYYTVKAQYDCGSKTWIIWYSIRLSGSYDYRIWDQIEIYCDEENPKKFVPKEIFPGYFLISLFILLFDLAVWLLMLWYWIKKEKLRKRLIKNGIKVEATITSITQAWWSQQIYNQKWYTITAKYWDDTFVSKNVFENTNNIVKGWEKIDVYFDTEDHSKYWMDIDSVFEKLDDNNSINN